MFIFAIPVLLLSFVQSDVLLKQKNKVSFRISIYVFIAAYVHACNDILQYLFSFFSMVISVLVFVVLNLPLLFITVFILILVHSSAEYLEMRIQKYKNRSEIAVATHVVVFLIAIITNIIF